MSVNPSHSLSLAFVAVFLTMLSSVTHACLLKNVDDDDDDVTTDVDTVRITMMRGFFW